MLAGAARIFAVSNFTRNEIEKLFEIPSERIEVVYNAIDERFLRGHASAADRDLIARRYQVTYPFLLYAGRISAHKNVVRMIEAFSALKTELERDQAYPDLKAHHYRRRSFRQSGSAANRGAQRSAERRALPGICPHRSAADFL